MLTHRSGTAGEDLYLVSVIDGKVKAAVTGSKGYLEVTPTKDLLDAVSENPDGTLFSVHNHPSNIPPTGSDLSASASRGYAGSIVVLHDGGIYYYKHGNAPFPPKLFDMECQKRIASGRPETDAIIETLDEFRREYGVKWKKIR
jgi:hypothetical protein